MRLDIYTLCSKQMAQAQVIDEVDSIIRIIDPMKDYNDVKNYIDEKFGDFDDIKIIDYPEIGKKIGLEKQENMIALCAGVGDVEYYGKCWKLVKRN